MTNSLVIWVSIFNPEPEHGLGWDVAETGWVNALTLNRRIDDAIAACEAAGVRPRVLLQLPFGDDGEGAMDFASRVRLMRERGKARDFPEWCGVFRYKHPGVELIIRLGDPQRDPELEPLRLAGNLAGYRSVWHRALLDVPNWASLGVDSTEELRRNHLAASLLQTEINGGRAVYSEPWPLKGSAVETWPFVVSEHLAFRSKDNPKWNAVPEDQITQEVIVQNPGINGQEVADFVRRVLDRGWTPAVGYGAVRDAVEGFE
ncbi:MAG: hypothetical protein AAF663_08420 [Planctomycetota bacterium]